MDTLQPFLNEKTEDHKYYMSKKFIYFTTVDGQRASYLLPLSKVKPFLSKYATVMETIPFHLNVLLTALTKHFLCVDVDYKSSTTNSTQKDAELIYRAIVLEIQQEMIFSNHDPNLFDAYYLTREGSNNFHLIFPHLFLNRVDFLLLLSKVSRSTNISIDTVHGWMMYFSTKRKMQSYYQVIGQLKENRSYMVSEPDLSVLVKNQYKSKNIHFIYTHLFFPAELPWFKTVTYIQYPIEITTHVGSNSDTCYLLSYMDTKMNVHHLSIVKKNSHFEAWTHDLYQWCKNNQEQFEIRSKHTVIHSYLKQFYPPLCLATDEEEEQSQPPSTVMHIEDLELSLKELYYQVGFDFSVYQFMTVIRDYQKYYSSVIGDILNTDKKKCSYTKDTILYELTFRFGETFSLISIYICKKMLREITRLMKRGEVENYYKYLGERVLPTIPLKVIEKEILLFYWKDRTWLKISMNTFTNLFLNELVDYVIHNEKDYEVKKKLRLRRPRFAAEHRVESILYYCFQTKHKKFDINPWILGLEYNNILDLQTCNTRLAIPEDYISKHMNYAFNFQNKEDFHIFLNEQDYMLALDKLKNHVRETRAIHHFVYTGIKAIDALFAFLAPIFCQEYEEMRFFLEFMSYSFIGRNYNRWILFLIGKTSNSKTTLSRLCLLVFDHYGGVLNPNIFYLSAKNLTGNEAPSPQIHAKLLHRIVIVEEVSPHSTLNASVLNSYSGNNRIFSRDLFKSGSDNDIHFKMIFTMNNYPTVHLTPALEQRIKILKFNSSFFPTETEYNFETRCFPQAHNLNLEWLGDPFLSLLIHVLSCIQERPNQQIYIPDSVKNNLKELGS